jgi:hypothetical protein
VAQSFLHKVHTPQYYKITRRHIPEDDILQIHCREKLRSDNLISVFTRLMQTCEHGFETSGFYCKEVLGQLNGHKVSEKIIYCDIN